MAAAAAESAGAVVPDDGNSPAAPAAAGAGAGLGAGAGAAVAATPLADGGTGPSAGTAGPALPDLAAALGMDPHGNAEDRRQCVRRELAAEVPLHAFDAACGGGEGVRHLLATVGGPMLKVDRHGKAKKKHFRIVPVPQGSGDDAGESVEMPGACLDWVPSKKAGAVGRVDLRHATTVYSGQHTSTFARCKSAALRAALVPVHEQVRHGPAAAAGFLFKKGGAKGGRRTWKKRWCMLSGTQLAYFVDAGQVQAKGNIDVSGCSVEKTESAKYEHQFTLKFPGAEPPLEPRELRADSAAEAEHWIAVIARAAASTSNTASGENAAGAGAGAGAGSGVGTSVLPDNVAPLCISVCTPEDGDASGSDLSSVNVVCPSRAEFDRWLPALQSLVEGEQPCLADMLSMHQRALSANDHDAFAHVALARLLMRHACDAATPLAAEELVLEARGHLQTALRERSELRTAHLLLARLMQQQDEVNGTAAFVDAALSSIAAEQALPEEQHSPQPLLDAHRAIAAVLDAVRLDSLGDTAAAEAKYREAVADGDKANAAGAGAAPAAEARARLGLLLHRLGRVQEASALLDAACEQRPDVAWGHVLAGQCWEAQGDVGKARACYERAIEASPRGIWGHRALALCLRAQGKHEAALPRFAACASVLPKNVRVLVDHARSLIACKQALQAATLVRTAADLFLKGSRPVSSASRPTSVDSDGGSGALPDVSSALDLVTAAEAVLEAHSDMVDVDECLGRLLARLRALAPESPAVYLASARLALRHDKFDEADGHLSSAAVTDSTDAEPLRQLVAERRAAKEKADAAAAAEAASQLVEQDAEPEFDEEGVLIVNLDRRGKTQAQREAEFFEAMKRRTEAQKAAQKKAEEDMDEYELEEHRKRLEEQAEHEKKKQRVIGQLSKYGGARMRTSSAGGGKPRRGRRSSMVSMRAIAAQRKPGNRRKANSAT